MRQNELVVDRVYSRTHADGLRSHRLLLSIQPGIYGVQSAFYMDAETEETSEILLSSFARWAEEEVVPKDPSEDCGHTCHHDLARGVTIPELLGGDDPENPNPYWGSMIFSGSRALVPAGDGENA